MFIIYLILAPIIALLLIFINFLISNNNKYQEKNGPFECGFTSFQQTRNAINISFILIAILFLPFDLEISTLLPFVISAYLNNLYGLFIFLFFIFSLLIAFIFEINLNALKLNSKYKSVVKPLIYNLYK